LRKKKENVLASASHDGGPASICHPSGSTDVLTPHWHAATEHPEFDAWEWPAPERLPDLIAPFKRQLHRDVLAEFREHRSANQS